MTTTTHFHQNITNDNLCHPAGHRTTTEKTLHPSSDQCSEEDTETSADKQKKEKPKDNETDNEDSEAKEPAEEKKPSDPRDVNSNFYHKQQLPEIQEDNYY